MAYEADRDHTKEPSIAEMTDKAIRILSKNEKGFFLLVEGNCHCLVIGSTYNILFVNAISVVQSELILVCISVSIFYNTGVKREVGMSW